METLKTIWHTVRHQRHHKEHAHMAIPSTWTLSADGSTATATNGFVVTGPILAYVQATTWQDGNDPLENLQSDNTQLFTAFELVLEADGVTVMLGDAGSQLQAAEAQVTTLHDQITAAQAEIQQLQQQIQQLQGGGGPTAADFAALKSKVDDLAATTATLQSAITALTEQIANLPPDPTPRVAALETTVANLQTLIGQIPAETLADIVKDLTPPEAPPTA